MCLYLSNGLIGYWSKLTIKMLTLSIWRMKASVTHDTVSAEIEKKKSALWDADI